MANEARAITITTETAITDITDAKIPSTTPTIGPVSAAVKWYATKVKWLFRPASTPIRNVTTTITTTSTTNVAPEVNGRFHMTWQQLTV